MGTLEGPGVFTPDDIAAGAQLQAPVVVYDFDNYYMGSVLAEHLARGGERVSYVTPAGHASAWAIMSNEQPQIHRTLFAARIALHTLSRVTAFERGEVTLANQFTNATTRLPCASLVIVGARFANDELYGALSARTEETAARASSQSRASAMRSRPEHSCTPCTAAIATPRSSMPTLRVLPSGAMRRWPLHERRRAAGRRPARPAPQRIRVRWKIFLFLFAFGFIVYVQQRSLTVAGYRMMPDLGFSQIQIGWLEKALLIGYTAMQFPGGVIGQRLGARLMFVVIGLIAVAACW